MEQIEAFVNGRKVDYLLDGEMETFDPTLATEYAVSGEIKKLKQGDAISCMCIATDFDT